jgi:hypothetical protein
MHTLATVQSTIEVAALVRKLEAMGCVAEYTDSTVTVRSPDGKLRKMSAVTITGKEWSVHVAGDIAAALKLPLWKDLP